MWLDYSDEPLSVSSGVVHLWLTRLVFSDDQLFSYQNLLSDAEMMRGNRLIKRSDQEKFFLSKAILRRILARYLNLPPEKIEFKLGKNGKPYVDRADFHFNVSHSGDCLLIGVTAGNEIGVDVEHVREKQDVIALAERFFSKAEYDAIKILSSENQIAAFYRCWTRKEAFIKATGLGLSFGLSNFEVAVENLSHKKSALLSIKNNSVESKKWTLQSIEIDDFSKNYFAAFAVQDAVTSIVCRRYSSSSIDSIK